MISVWNLKVGKLGDPIAIPDVPPGPDRQNHLLVRPSADGKFMVTAMHEAALHGWRLVDAKHMRMTGYPGRVRSMAWTTGGKAGGKSAASATALIDTAAPARAKIRTQLMTSSFPPIGAQAPQG